jgi:death-on-curing protein
VNPAPEFLTLEEVFSIHKAQLERWGGLDGVRDLRALESAVMQPQAGFGGEFLHQDLFAMASAYAFHIAQAQGFIDGNKRTGLDAALTFLALNGHRITDTESALFDAMVEIACKTMTKAQLADLLRELAGI